MGLVVEPIVDAGALGASMAHRLAGVAAVFVPGDPPRSSRVAFWDPEECDTPPRLAGLAVTTRDVVELVLPAGKSVRRRTVAAATISTTSAIDLFASLPLRDDLHETVVAWSSVF